MLVFELDPDIYEVREDAGIVNLNISLAEGHVEELSIVLTIEPIHNNSNNDTATGKKYYTQ